MRRSPPGYGTWCWISGASTTWTAPARAFCSRRTKGSRRRACTCCSLRSTQRRMSRPCFAEWGSSTRWARRSPTPTTPSSGPKTICSGRCDPPEPRSARSEEHTSELQSLTNLVCRLLLEKKKGMQKLVANVLAVFPQLRITFDAQGARGVEGVEKVGARGVLADEYVGKHVTRRSVVMFKTD